MGFLPNMIIGLDLATKSVAPVSYVERSAVIRRPCYEWYLGIVNFVDLLFIHFKVYFIKL